MIASAARSRGRAIQRDPTAGTAVAARGATMTPTTSITGRTPGGSRVASRLSWAGWNQARGGRVLVVVHQQTRRRRVPTCPQPRPMRRVRHRAGAFSRRYATLRRGATLTAVSAAPSVIGETASTRHPVACR